MAGIRGIGEGWEGQDGLIGCTRICGFGGIGEIAVIGRTGRI